MKASKISLGTMISIIALGALLALSAAGVFMAFKIGGFRAITIHGWIALGLAVVFTGLLTGGLIWLALYSSNHGYDDR